jgi:serine/threonine protein kinase
VELHDNDCIESIRYFVRNNPDVEVYEYIRRGCNGEVYFGKRNKMGDDVVLKFYWSHPNYDATEEAVILKNINHPNILKIHDLRFLAPNYAYFLTPKISGGDLQAIIENRNLSTKEALNIIAGILLGLTELHSSHKLVHRDLKPGNILIDLSEKRSIIADLGAVKKIDSASGHVTASKSTTLYLPPEAIVSNKYYFQSDIYQVGVILFQLLGGFFPINEPYKWLSVREMKKLDLIKSPIEKESAFATIINTKIIKGKLIDLTTLPYYLDPQFKRVLHKALNIDHEERYKTPFLFLKDIHQLLRKYPEYITDTVRLFVNHDNGKQFQIYKNAKEEIIIEKRMTNKEWRKDHSHNGTIEAVLAIARLN